MMLPVVAKGTCGCLILSMWLASCGVEVREEPSGEIDPPQASMPDALRQQLLAEAERARLAFEEMRTVQGPVVRARMLRPGPIEIADASGSQAGGGAYSRQARLLADGSEITVYIPDDVALSADALVDVMVGEHGHYFVEVITDP